VTDQVRVDQTRWLDAEEGEAWRSLMRLVMVLPGALDTQLQRDSGLSTYEYLVLARLSENPERRLRLSELAPRSYGSLSRLSHVVSRLSAMGLVERVPCQEDRRVTFAVLTDQGYARLVEAAPGHVEHVRTVVLDQLPRDQLLALGAAAERILTGSTSD